MGGNVGGSSAGAGSDDREVMAVVDDRLEGTLRSTGDLGGVALCDPRKELIDGLLSNDGVDDRSVEATELAVVLL